MKTITPIPIEKMVIIFQALPDDVQTSLFAEETADKMAKLREKHSLTDEQWPQIVRTVGRTMMAILIIKDFVRNIVEIAGIDNDKAAALAKDINQEIFQPVRESLMQVHEITNGEPMHQSKHDAGQTGIGNQKSGTANQSPKMPRSQVQSPEKRKISKTKIIDSKPLSLEELETREATIKETPKPPAPQNTDGHKSDKARAELIDRLKKERGEKTTSDKGQETRNTNSDTPKATEAAWNGRTIDLTKIPPRRKSPKNSSARENIIEVEIHEA